LGPVPTKLKLNGYATEITINSPKPGIDHEFHLLGDQGGFERVISR